MTLTISANPHCPAQLTHPSATACALHLRPTDIFRAMTQGLAILLLWATWLTTTAWAADIKTYKVAIDAEYAPYEFVATDNRVQGMLPDLLREMEPSAQLRFEFIPMTWPDAVAALESGRVDLVNMIRSPERIGKYEFSEPHSRIYQALFRNTAHEEIHNLASLTGARVALQNHDIAIEKLLTRDDFERVLVNSKQTGFLMVNSGQVAAFFSAEQPGLYFLREHKLKRVELAATNLFPQAFAFASKMGNTAIITLLNTEMAKLRQSGRYDEIVQKWLLPPPSWLQRHKQGMTIAAALLVLLATGFALWNIQLRHTVRKHTRNLAADRERLQKSEEQFRQLAENIHEVFWMTDLQKKIMLYISPAYEHIWGRTCQALYAAPQQWIEAVHPDDRPRVYNATLEKQTSGTYDEEYRIERPDGTTRWIRDRAFPIQNEHGEVYRLAGVAEDITERRTAEAATTRLLKILASTSDFIGMADAEGHLLYINAAGRHMVGLDVNTDISSMMITEFHPAQEARRVLDDILPQTVRDGVCQCECLFLTQNGDEIPTSSVFMAHDRSNNGQAKLYSVIARDLTAERDMQAKIEHSQRLESLGVLAGGIAHDFNNILTTILGNAAMAERKQLKKAQDTGRHLANIVTASEKAAELCKQMLAYSGRGKFVVKTIDLSVLVEDITRLLEISISKNVVLKYYLTSHLPAIDADAAQIQQVIMNLVINASDAIGNKSGVISISTDMMQADKHYLQATYLDDQLKEGPFVCLEVSDTGCGMDTETQKQIFEPFFTTKPTGHGLGMSAVLGIVRGHHGAIKVYSEPGIGTTFKVLLPMSQLQIEASTPTTIPSHNWRGSGTVLIVDDEPSILETAAMMLETMGFATLTATDGLNGLEVYRQHQDIIVAVLLDMTMPKMDGKTCFMELRHIRPDVKVILTSGYNEQEATSRFTGKGLAGFIQKPYRPEQLQDKMQEIQAGSPD